MCSSDLLISAGGTREELDPVRFLGNWSTGTQGYAFARSAAAKGADVTLVAANVELADPAGVKVVRVVSARDMHAAMLAGSPGADAIIMTAAVADFRPLMRAEQKIKKDGTLPPPIELTENPDILAGLSRRRSEQGPAGQVIVGFAAETDPDLDAARAKLARKGCDLLVALLMACVAELPVSGLCFFLALRGSREACTPGPSGEAGGYQGQYVVGQGIL